MAEHGLSKAVGVAFDGTGYGTDGTIWGGEFLLCEGAEFKRVGKISPVKFVGGDASAKECDKTAMCYVRECVKRGLLEDSFWGDNAKYQAVLKAVDYGVNVVGSTSMGRLFDAVSVILDVCLINTYEAEAPMMLQACAENYVDEHSENECPDLKCMINYDEDEDIYVADTLRLFADVVKCKNAECDAGAVAFSFHRAVADMVVEMVGRFYESVNAKGVPVALSGGTMNNKLLLGMIIDGLVEMGYDYYINEQVEAGDGGLTLGQMLLTTQ
jgi:hydrogenase maturation protein HypF